ncbi:MAG: TetR/AcrR family transcriptional regulator [Acidobacteriaceae bacterium]|nr:TetR/AcrR family transcriptional regulator [Acidobacteriaceae bacterium]
MDDIAEHSGLSKGALYWYFKKKDDIITALLDRVFRKSIEALGRIAIEPVSVRDRVMRIGEQISRDYQAMARLMPIALEFYAIALRQRAVRKHLATLYGELLSIFTPLLEEGVRNAELEETDARRAATVLISMYEGLGLVWTIAPKLVDWKADGPHAAVLLCNGLGSRKSRQSQRGKDVL